MKDLHDAFLENYSLAVAILSFVFGAGCTWAGFKFSQKSLSDRMDGIMAEMKSIKVQMQQINDQKSMFVLRLDCMQDQGKCQQGLCFKLDDLKDLIEKSRDREQINAVDISRLEAKIDMLIGQRYGRNSG